ncbi:hypothetical protein BBJ28_00018610 [Nothophytophthora sp. Chile5]|nr:hypothetical protein BBJ28_00018610 [Nothophytophthora sp. Chile5]
MQRRVLRHQPAGRGGSRRPPAVPTPPSGSTAALAALIAAICGVQYQSHLAFSSVESAHFVANHFLTSRNHLQQGRVYTLVTSTLYTPIWSYALGNLFWLWLAGRNVCQTLGGTRFLALFFGSGAIANAVALARWKDGNQSGSIFPKMQLPGGGSCAVDCIVALNALLYPPSRVAISRRWLRWPVWVFSGMFLTRDERDRPPWVPDAAPREAHVTGVLCGLATFLALRRRPRHL